MGSKLSFLIYSFAIYHSIPFKSSYRDDLFIKGRYMVFTAFGNVLRLSCASLVLYPEYSWVAEDVVIFFKNWISFWEAILSAVAAIEWSLSEGTFWCLRHSSMTAFPCKGHSQCLVDQQERVLFALLLKTGIFDFPGKDKMLKLLWL